MLTFLLLCFLVLLVGCKKFSFWNLTNIFCQIFHFYLAPMMSKHYTKGIISFFFFFLYHEDKEVR